MEALIIFSVNGFGSAADSQVSSNISIFPPLSKVFMLCHRSVTFALEELCGINLFSNLEV